MKKIIYPLAILALPLASACTTTAGTSTEAIDPMEDTVRVTGSAFYRERIALPGGSDMHVIVEDISLADAPAQVLAQQYIDLADKNVPVAFELDVPRRYLNDAVRTNLRIRLEGPNGELLFITDTIRPVKAVEGSATVDMGNVMLVKVAR